MRLEAALVHAYFFAWRPCSPHFMHAHMRRGCPRSYALSSWGSCAVQFAPRMCMHTWLRVSTDIFTNFACCLHSEASLDGREVLVPFDRYAVLTVIRPTLCLFGHFSITKRGSPQKIQNGRPVMLKLSHAYSWKKTVS